jgi:hypothetical protein
MPKTNLCPEDLTTEYLAGYYDQAVGNSYYNPYKGEDERALYDDGYDDKIKGLNPKAMLKHCKRIFGL